MWIKLDFHIFFYIVNESLVSWVLNKLWGFIGKFHSKLQYLNEMIIVNTQIQCFDDYETIIIPIININSIPAILLPPIPKNFVFPPFLVYRMTFLGKELEDFPSPCSTFTMPVNRPPADPCMPCALALA